MRRSPLHFYTAADWDAAVDAMRPEVHEVDRDAAQIWRAFFPVALADAYEAAADTRALTRRLRIDGNPRLVSGQIDTSHWFLYGHRYWPEVKAAVLTRVAGAGGAAPPPLVDLMRATIADTAARVGAEAAVVAGITQVGLLTLRQVGLEAFRAAVSSPTAPLPRRSADAVVARRARDDRQGVLRLLRSTKRFSVVFDEQVAEATFPILDGQHLTTASAADGRDYTRGPRRFQEGPIPAQCRSATCGTCWVGVLGGRAKLSAVDPYEARRLREFGYSDGAGTLPVIRLACQAQASGNVTIVIPPWNGFVSRLET